MTSLITHSVLQDTRNKKASEQAAMTKHAANDSSVLANSAEEGENSNTHFPNHILSTEAAYWKEQYEALSKLRKTEVEEQLEMYKGIAEDREKTLLQMIQHLESRLPRSSSTSTSASSLPAEVSAQLVSQDALLTLYRRLTSTQIALTPSTNPLPSGSPPSFTCLTVNPSKSSALQFTLTGAPPPHDGKHDLLFVCTANPQNLPPVLRGAASSKGVVIEGSEVPFLLKTIYNTDMFKEEDE